MKEVTLQDLMTPSPGWCTLHDPVERAAQLMAEHDCGAIPVVDDVLNRRPVGMITDRDIVLRLVVTGRAIANCQVREAMTPNPVTLHSSATFMDCARVMRERRVRRVVVLDDRGHVIGMVTDGDLARACACNPDMEHEVARMVEHVSRPGQFGAEELPAIPVVTGSRGILDRPNHRG
jgi:CBS domain-containing protein